MKLVCHCLNVVPVLRVELIIALLCPVEIIADDYGKRNALLLIAPCNLKQILLSFIAEAALPEARCPVGHNGGVTRNIRKGFAYLLRRTADENEIHFTRCAYSPAGAVFRKLNRTYRGIVP